MAHLGQGALIGMTCDPPHLLCREGGNHLPPTTLPRYQKIPGGCSHREQALSTLLNADPIGVLHKLLLLPPLRLLPLMEWHTKTIFVYGTQTRPLAAVALGNNLPPKPNRPLTWRCLGTPSTRRPQLGPLNGLGNMQVGESHVRALG